MNTFTKSFTTLSLASMALVGCMTANGPATAEQA